MDWINQHYDVLVTYAFAAMGVATAIVAGLNAVVVPLRDLAKLTETKTDDEFVELLAKLGVGASELLLALGKLIAPIALKHPGKAFPKAPEGGAS